MSSLPTSGFVAFYGAGYKLGLIRYLCHMREDGPFKNILKVCGDDALTPYTRFHLEPSANYEGLVHIRSCYNKYWVVAKADDGRWYVFVNGKQPEEDKDKPSCTLFQLGMSAFNENLVGIRACSSLVQDASSVDVEEAHCNYLSVTTGGSFVWLPQDLDYANGFVLATLKEEKLLPKYVRFKGDNGKYLGSDDGNVLEFKWTDPCDARIIHTIHYDDTGSRFRIKSEKVGRFWRRDYNNSWIAPKDDGSNQDNTWFEVVMLGGNTIALKCQGNGRFAKRLTSGGHEDGLNAGADTLEVCARLQLEEAVISRKISGVKYRLDEADIYDQKAVFAGRTHAVNDSDTEATAKLSIKYSMSTTSSWSTSITKSWGVNGSVNFGLPKLLEKIGLGLEIKVDGHFEKSDTDEKGGYETRTEEYSEDFEMKVPPRTKMTLNAFVKQATTDIPYSYYQEDILTNGVHIGTKLEDGVFHGVSSYDFNYEIIEEKLDDDKKGNNKNLPTVGNADGLACQNEPAAKSN